MLVYRRPQMSQNYVFHNYKNYTDVGTVFETVVDNYSVLKCGAKKLTAAYRNPRVGNCRRPYKTKTQVNHYKRIEVNMPDTQFTL